MMLILAEKMEEENNIYFEQRFSLKSFKGKSTVKGKYPSFYMHKNWNFNYIK